MILRLLQHPGTDSMRPSTVSTAARTEFFPVVTNAVLNGGQQAAGAVHDQREGAAR